MMFWQSASLILFISGAVSNAQDTTVEEVSADNENSNTLYTQPEPISMDNSLHQQYNQNYQPYKSIPIRYPSYTRPSYNMPSNYPYYPQQPQYSMPLMQAPMNYWGPSGGNSLGASWGGNAPVSWPNYPIEQQQYPQETPNLSAYTDSKNGFYPGSPNWRKSFTPSSNGCFNRCRPSCGYGNYMYGCRPVCRPSCNIRPSCGSSTPQYYGDTMVCGKDNTGYYRQQPNFGYRSGGGHQLKTQMMNQENPTLSTAITSGLSN